MKHLLLPFALLFFATSFLCSSAFAEDDEESELRNAIENLRDAETRDADDEEFDDDEFEDDDFEDDEEFEEEDEDFEELLDKVTREQVKAMLQKHFAKETKWVRELGEEEEEVREEAKEMLGHAAREAVVIREHEPDEFEKHLKITKAEIAYEYYEYQLFEGDDPKAAAVELKKAMKTLHQIEIAELKRELEHIKEVIAELEEFDIDAEVEEMLQER